MTLSVEVDTARRERSLVLPLAAFCVAGADGSPTVLMNDAGHARESNVRLGLRTLEAVEAVDGLVEGDQVLVACALKAGQRLQVQVVLRQLTQRTNGGAAPDAGTALTSAMGR
jgi:HlyD family secretion protein